MIAEMYAVAVRDDSKMVSNGRIQLLNEQINTMTKKIEQQGRSPEERVGFLKELLRLIDDRTLLHMNNVADMGRSSDCFSYEHTSGDRKGQIVERFALVIANKSYKHDMLEPLNECLADAEKMMNYLHSAGYQIRYHEDLKTVQEFRTEVDNFVKSTKASAKGRTPGEIDVLFYFAGHGLFHQAKNGGNYLVPTQPANLTKAETVPGQCMSVNDIKLCFYEFRVKLFLLDCCSELSSVLDKNQREDTRSRMLLDTRPGAALVGG